MPNQDIKNQNINKRMTALVVITLISSVIGGWPYLALAAVFLYTQIFAKITPLTIITIIGLIAIIPIVKIIITNSKQLLKTSSRVGYFALVGLSTFSSSMGIYNMFHNVLIAIGAGFVVLILIISVFSEHDEDSEDKKPLFTMKSWTSDDSFIPKDPIRKGGTYMRIVSVVSLLISVALIVITIGAYLLSLCLKAIQSAGNAESMGSADIKLTNQTIEILEQTPNVLITILGITIIIAIISLIIAYNADISRSKNARKTISKIENFGAQVYITRILHLQKLLGDSAFKSFIDYCDNNYAWTSFLAVVNDPKAVSKYSSLSYSVTAGTFTKLLLNIRHAYPNMTQNATPEEFINILKNYTQYDENNLINFEIH